MGTKWGHDQSTKSTQQTASQRVHPENPPSRRETPHVADNGHLDVSATWATPKLVPFKVI